MQDIPSRNPATPGKAHALTLAVVEADATERRERLRVLLLGTNLWALCVLWPALSVRSGHAVRGIDLAFETLGLLPLALGAAWSRDGAGASASAARSALRPALLLVVFPTALSAAIALRGEALNQQLFGPFALCLVAVSLCAYGAAVATSMGTRAGAALRAKHVALGAEPWDAPPNERELPRRAFIAACVAGAGALALIAPRLGGRPELDQAAGDAASVGDVLTAVVGAALAVTLLAVHLSDGLRAPAARDVETDSGLRTAWFLFLALLGALTFYVVQP